VSALGVDLVADLLRGAAVRDQGEDAGLAAALDRPATRALALVGGSPAAQVGAGAVGEVPSVAGLVALDVGAVRAKGDRGLGVRGHGPPGPGEGRGEPRVPSHSRNSGYAGLRRSEATPDRLHRLGERGREALRGGDGDEDRAARAHAGPEAAPGQRHPVLDSADSGPVVAVRTTYGALAGHQLHPPVGDATHHPADQGLVVAEDVRVHQHRAGDHVVAEDRPGRASLDLPAGGNLETEGPGRVSRGSGQGRGRHQEDRRYEKFERAHDRPPITGGSTAIRVPIRGLVGVRVTPRE
jgi:hypothetical protein